MRIKYRIRQYRRHFTARFECEHCGHERLGDGYDDANFHQNVIPSLVCPSCGRKGSDPSSWPIVPAGVVL